jgi:hypothetical protein
MAVAKLTCPKCKAVLRPARPVEEGKKVKCPKCTTVFAARAEEEEAIAAKPAAKGAPAAKKPSSAAPAKKGAPAAKKSPPKKVEEPEKPKKYVDPDDDGPAVYSFVHDPKDDVDEDDDDEDDETKIDFNPDLSVKDPRGPAQAAVIKPSNFLMAVSVLTLVANVTAIGFAVWPMIFADSRLEPKDVLKDPQKKGAPLMKEEKDLNSKEKDEFYAIDDLDLIDRWIRVGMGTFCVLYSGFMCIGCVKMQQLESYRWAWTAVIMALIPVGGIWAIEYFMYDRYYMLDEWASTVLWNVFPAANIAAGIVCMVTLRDPKVQAGFTARSYDQS